MAFSAANIDPGTTPSLPVAVETINSKDYQAVKLVDGTVGSETPVGTSGNPLNTLDSQVLAELVLVLAKLNASIAVTGTFWQATQPVSGTVTITPSGTQTVSGTVGVSGNVATTSAAASQADGHSAAIGATTDAAATTTGSVIAQLRRIANAIAGTLTVSGTVTTTPPSNASSNVAQINGVTPQMGAGSSGTGSQRIVEAGSATGTQSSVAASGTTVSLLASNTARRGATFYNEPGGAVLYLKLGATASLTSYTIQVAAGGYYECPAFYNGAIDGLWASVSGNVRITEIT